MSYILEENVKPFNYMHKDSNQENLNTEQSKNDESIDFTAKLLGDNDLNKKLNEKENKINSMLF